SSLRSNLAPGASTTVSGTVSQPSVSPATYFVGAIADYTSILTESNESNNSLAGNQLDLPCVYGNPDINIVKLSLELNQSGKSASTAKDSDIDLDDPRAIRLKNNPFIPPDAGVKSTWPLPPGYSIVLMDEPLSLMQVDALESQGVDVLYWIPNNAVMVYVPPTKASIEPEGIAWVGKMNPSDKIS